MGVKSTEPLRKQVVNAALEGGAFRPMDTVEIVSKYFPRTVEIPEDEIHVVAVLGALLVYIFIFRR